MHTLAVKRDDILQRGLLISDADTHRTQPLFDIGRQRARIGLLDVMRVEPSQLFGVELRRRRRDVVQIEPLAELRHAEHFIIAVRPAQTREIVQHGFRQIAFFMILHDADRAVALGKLLTVVAENHGKMRILRHSGTQRMQQIDLARRVVDMIVAANHVRNAHVPVIDHHAEVVSWRAIGTGNDEVIQLAIRNDDTALDLIIPGHITDLRVSETHHRLHAGWRSRQLLALLRPPGTVVARLQTGLHLRRAHLFQRFRRGIAVIGATGIQHLLDHFLVAVDALHLIERTFVLLQPQPCHAVQNRLHGLRCRTCDVGIFNTQNEFAVVFTGVCP